MLKPVIAAACLCATIAHAQSSDLSGEQINDLLAGATVEIHTPAGTRLPVRYARDGNLSGEARDLAWYLGTATDKGRWWVASSELCHKWSRWFNSEPQCMRLRKEGRIIRWRNRDGHSGIAFISVPASIQAAAASPPAQPSRVKDAVSPEALPESAGPPEKEVAEPAPTPRAPPPSQKVVEDAAGPAPGEEVPAALDGTPGPQKEAQPKHEPQPKYEAQPEDQAEPKDRAEPKRTAQPTFRVANVRRDDTLNVRSGPSADFDIVGALPPGSRGIAITSACRSGWCPVQHGAASGWVNRAYLASEEPLSPVFALRDASDAPRSCLTAAARALLDRIEQAFGPLQVISTCRPGATIPGTWRASRHASGNAVDFKAGSRKAAIVEWLIANHRSGGTMTYAGMDHIHVDIGPRFVSVANGPRWRSWRDSGGDAFGPR